MQIVGDLKINNDSSVTKVVTALINSGYNVNVMPCKKKKRVRLVITKKGEREDK